MTSTSVVAKKAGRVGLTALATVLAACTTTSEPSVPAPAAVSAPAATTHTTRTGETGTMRAPAQVPGALADPAPTLAALCRAGYTRTVRPPATYTDDLKRRQLAGFGYADQNPAHYEEDHLVPLELAGAPRDEHNLWPQPWAEARQKDRQENDLHQAVCSGQRALSDAQHQMLTDWGPQ